MSFLSIEDLHKSYRTRRHGDVTALAGVDVDVAEGTYMVFVGPSGSGKTTALRCVVGLEVPDRGRVRVGGRELVDTDHGVCLPPEKRGLGMVFQNYGLWPHLTVAQNVAFGLRMAKRSRAVTKQAVSASLAAVGLAGYEERRVNELSGGQMQRVGLARAMAIDPDVILMDEPLSNLDPAIKLDLRDELKGLHLRAGRTTIHVTHDQEEALFLADVIAVFHDGRIEQIGPADELRTRPATMFVADFLGWRNRLAGVVCDGALRLSGRPDGISIPLEALGDIPSEVVAGSEVDVAIHPDGVRLAAPGSARAARRDGAPRAVRARIETAAYYSGWVAAGTVRLEGTDVRLHFRAGDTGIRYEAGEAVVVSLEPAQVRVFARPSVGRGPTDNSDVAPPIADVSALQAAP